MKSKVDGTNVQDCVTDNVSLSESALENTANHSNSNTTESTVIDETNDHRSTNDEEDNSQMINVGERNANRDGSKE